jgi:hypothetical protein
VLVKTAEEAKTIVAQQLSSELADAAGYKEKQKHGMFVQWLGAVRVYYSIGRRRSVLKREAWRYDIFGDGTVDEQHEAVPNTRQNTGDRAPGIAGPTVWAREGILYRHR